MARLDRAALDAASFPTRIAAQTRFDDLDILGHVNNAAAVVLLQEARVDFGRRAGLAERSGGLRMMVVGLLIEFASELTFPAPVELLTGCARIGRSSYTLAQLARQQGRTAIYAEATMVFTDASGAAPMPESIREGLIALQIGSKE